MAIYLGSCIPILAGNTPLEGLELWAFWGVVVALGIGWFVLFLRLATLRARTTPGGLEIRNPLRTYRVPWSRVESIDLGSDRRHSSIAIATLTGGGTISISAVRGNKGWLIEDESAAKEIVEEMEADRKRFQSFEGDVA